MITLFTTLLDANELTLFHQLQAHVKAHQQMALPEFLLEELQTGRASILAVESPEFKGLTLWQ